MQYEYLTTTSPIGGRIKENIEDFLVEELGDNYETKVTYLPNNKVETEWTSFFNKRNNESYIHVDLEKYNTSTTDAINQLSRFLRISKRRVGYAGLKDKRGITVQRISIYDPPLERISKFYYKNIKIYNPLWSNSQIDIGDLEKNRFIVTIRQIKDISKENLQKTISTFQKQIQETGVINYFGEQRFGGVRSITHKVGKLLLQKKYKEAVLCYLTESFDLENEDLKQARKDLKETLNFKKHAYNFPTRTGYERQLINHLANHDEDYLGALKVLPKSIQYLFIHAYQSYLFNMLINKILKKKIVLPENTTLQLFGYESFFSDGLLGDLEKELFDEEGISFEHFYNSDYKVLSSKGERRAFKCYAEDFQFLFCEEDELHENQLKVKVSFVLDKGHYATNILRELIKPNHQWY